MLQITAHGNIGRDPEQRQAGQSTVVNFPLAVTTGKDETTWLECAVWGKRGDTAMAYLTKGSRITVAGRAKLTTFQAKDGTERQKLQLDVSDFTLPPRPQEGQEPQRRAPAPAPRQWQEESEPLPF